MKASLINIRLTSRYSAGSYAFAVKGLCALSGQVHSLMAALTCLRSVETNLTLTCPSPKSFVCNLPDSGRHVTSVFQGLSLSRFVGRVGENPGNEVDLLLFSAIRIRLYPFVRHCWRLVQQLKINTKRRSPWYAYDKDGQHNLTSNIRIIQSRQTANYLSC